MPAPGSTVSNYLSVLGETSSMAKIAKVSPSEKHDPMISMETLLALAPTQHYCGSLPFGVICIRFWEFATAALKLQPVVGVRAYMAVKSSMLCDTS